MSTYPLGIGRHLGCQTTENAHAPIIRAHAQLSANEQVFR